jgi:hypothetical protein
MSEKKEYKLVVNKNPHDWGEQFITGSQIKTLAGSPADWVVNLRVPGPAPDPDIGDAQRVDLDEKAEPQGVKRFTTRKPATAPGA